GAAAEEAIADIARAVAAADDVPPASLARGGAGLALLFAFLDRARPGEGHDERARAHVDAAIDALATQVMDDSLYAGFTGVAWVTEVLLLTLPDDGGAGDGEVDGEVDDLNEDVDEALLELLARSPWRRDCDLVSGLTGHAVYALERLRRPSARECLERILDRLEESAERRDGGATWKTRPELLIERTRRDHPDGYYDVGVAHGAPGVVAVLAAMAAAGIGGGRARALLDQATRWVLGCRLHAAPGRSRFPTLVGDGIEPRPARFAWCYGDPGVAAALLAAARASGDERLEAEALAVARRAAAEPTARADVIDAGLCHGAAGVAHLFNRMHQATGDEACADAARRWFARALALRRPGEGLGGYLSFGAAGEEAPGWREDAGLVTGAAGTALALLAAVSPVEPIWDRMLCASTVTFTADASDTPIASTADASVAPTAAPGIDAAAPPIAPR
ncbi:MAG TPA: lanthionine synthetase C family protein, partial [Kofleriaceae bacterium]|nr:lanthionine synthetase C family protein [Kofleriaceae bacterium]